MYKIGAVSYLNTKPLLYGLQQQPIAQHIQLIQDYPANIAKLLLTNKIDIGLVPVAIIPKMDDHFIVSDYCIGATQSVASVAIFSKVPLQKVKTIILDYQSRTSVALTKVLMKYYFKQEVNFIPATENFIDDINNTTAAVVIGDRALELLAKFEFVTDLAQAWIHFSQLPFVFAAWVANKKIDASFIQEFNKANAFGLENLDSVIAQNPYPAYDLKAYYTQNISYHLNEAKMKGLQFFLSFLC
jgi:chorismate dehydratase